MLHSPVIRCMLWALAAGAFLAGLPIPLFAVPLED